MQYYSKSPKDLAREREQQDEKRNNKFGRGRKVLIFDLLLLIALAFLFVFLRSESSSPSTIETNKSIEWKNWAITGGCEKGKCQIAVNLINANSKSSIKKNDQQKEIPKVIKWQMVEDQGTLLHESVREFVTTDEKGVYSSKFTVPMEWIHKSVSVKIHSGKEEEEITFKVYP